MESPSDIILIKDWITIGATILGPILAVLATRVVDYYRQKKERKTNIFSTLMMTRMSKLSPDHIAALNAIEIVFYNDKAVHAEWKKYLENLSTDVSAFSEAGKANHYAKRERMFAKLVTQMAKVLGIRIEQLDIINENYMPQGWADNEEEQRELRKNLVALLRGQIMLPVHVDKSPILEKNFETMRNQHASRASAEEISE